MGETYNNKERQINGRFGTGNTFGRGRPRRETEAEYIAVLFSECGIDRWKKIVTKAAEQAEGGEPKARAFLANYILGKPLERLEVENVVTEELTPIQKNFKILKLINKPDKTPYTLEDAKNVLLSSPDAVSDYTAEAIREFTEDEFKAL